MSKIKNGGLHQYGAKPLEQQQFGTAGVEGVKLVIILSVCVYLSAWMITRVEQIVTAAHRDL